MARHTWLGGAIQWPRRDILKRTMPLPFRVVFGTMVAVVLDCFDVFIEQPSSLITRALTWWNYKHQNTVKYLIGSAPQGSITFISKGWEGRTSDKVVTENCGVLDNLLPGNPVLADRAFCISDAVGLYWARLEIPEFIRGKAQPSKQLRNLRM